MAKKKLLILVDWFEPGFKGGGQIRSAVTLANSLKNDADVFIITGDRDFGDDVVYKGVTPDKWTSNNGYSTWYASPGTRNYKLVLQLIKSIAPDAIYVNGIFSWPSSILPLIIKRFAGIPANVVVAPRGMLKSSAKQFKSRKKDLYLFVSKMMGLHKKVSFHATDQQEAQDIREHFGASSKVTIISNAPPQVPAFMPVHKEAGVAKLIFIGRVHPVKNLLFLLEALEGQTDQIELTVITSEYHPQYWGLCQEKIKSLPANIKVVVQEHVPHHEIGGLLMASHAFVLPTQGENFGHAIFEAFAAGRPVIISDQTPWKNLQQKSVGWDIPLNDKKAFSDAIATISAMDQQSFDVLCRSVWNFAHNWVATNESKAQYMECFFA